MTASAILVRLNARMVLHEWTASLTTKATTMMRGPCIATL